jgi:WD40 repeat-containing protein SMU1
VTSFDLVSGKLLSSIKAIEKGEVIGLAHHPFSNILACNADVGRIALWRS